jgi:Uma2 family endonuclease
MTTTFKPTRLRISVDRFVKMFDAEVLTWEDRVELMDGDILKRPPITSARPVDAVTRLLERLAGSLGETAVVTKVVLLELDGSTLLSPDLCVLKPEADHRLEPYVRGSDVLLLIEVAEHSLDFYQLSKRETYARHGIPEYWVVDVNAQCVHVYHHPTEGSFLETREVGRTESVAPRAFPHLIIPVGDIFGISFMTRFAR